MKLLAITGSFEHKDINGIDLWRIYRPLTELRKHVDWQIDFQESLIRNKQDYETPEAFMRDGADAEAKHLGQYDIIFTSYYTDPIVAALLHVTEKHYGTKIILDIDDNLFNIDPLNPVWLKFGTGRYNGAYFVRKIAENAPYISTTNQYLAKRLQHSSLVTPKTFVIPNYISDDYHHAPFDNQDKLVIGFFGSSAHYQDLHETGLLPALQQLMHDYKHLYVEVIGQPVDDYLPTKRVTVRDSVMPWDWTDFFATLNFDIGLAPLIDSPFNKAKSDIKWQEYTRAGAAVVASNVGPYATLPAGTVKTVNNTQSQWYDAIKSLLVKSKRRKQVKTAQVALEQYRLEDHWQAYKTMFEDVHGS